MSSLTVPWAQADAFRSNPRPLRYPVQRIGRATVVAVVVSLVVGSLLDLFPLAGVALTEHARASDDMSPIAMALLLEVGLGLLTVLCLVVAGVLAIIWLYRARKNVDGWYGVALGPGAGWAIGGWFLPVANLFMPFRVTAYTVRTTLRLDSTPGIVWGWWIALLANQFFGSAWAATDDSDVALDSNAGYDAYADYFWSALGLNTIDLVLTLASGVLFCVIVRGVSRAQHEHEPLSAGLAAANPAPVSSAGPVPPPWSAGRATAPDDVVPPPY